MRTEMDSAVLQMIRAKDTDSLRALLRTRGQLPKEQPDSSRAFCTYLKSIDLTVLFGIGKTCRCIFHTDENPSASVYRSTGGDWLYFCHSAGCSCGGKAMNLFQFTAQLQGTDSAHALTFLGKVCGFKLPAKNTEDLFDENIALLDSGQFAQKCPVTAKLCRPELLAALYRFGKDSLTGSGIHSTGDRAVLSMSNGQYRKACSINFQRISAYLGMLAFLGFLRRVPLYELDDRRYTCVLRFLGEHRGYLPTNQLQVFRLTEDRLAAIEKAANQWKEAGYRLTNFRYGTVYQREGSFRAHELFPCGGQTAGFGGNRAPEAALRPKEVSPYEEPGEAKLTKRGDKFSDESL